jgi:hypothetical protein
MGRTDSVFGRDRVGMKTTVTIMCSALLLASLASTGVAQPAQPAQPVKPAQSAPSAEPGRPKIRAAPDPPDVWYGSNLGSTDLLDMFTAPDSWALARSRIDVMLLSGSQVATAGWSCTVLPQHDCADNHLDSLVAVQAFEKLGDWGIDIVIESFFAGPVASLAPVACSDSTSVLNLTLDGSLNVIAGVQSNEGVVASLRMDEPLRQWMPTYYYQKTGQTDPRPCLVSTLQEVADHVVPYLKQMKTWYPSLAIGHVELYPEVGVEALKQWIVLLEANKVPLPYLHLDVHSLRLQQYISFGLDIDLAADLRELAKFTAEHGVDFGVIYTDVEWNSQLWEPTAYDDEIYFENTLDWIELVEGSGIQPQHLIYQSWVAPYFTTGTGPQQIPVNLPEDDPAVFSGMRLLNETY